MDETQTEDTTQTTEETTQETETKTEETTEEATKTDSTTETSIPETEETKETESLVDDDATEETKTEDESAEEDKPAERIVPEPDSYKLPEGIPAEYGQFAHDNDMTQEQVDATLTKFGSYLEAQEATTLADIKAKGQEHTKAWGAEGPAKMTLAKRALSHIDEGGELATLLKTSGYQHHPAILDALVKAGSTLQEGGFIKSGMRTPKDGTKKTAAQVMFPGHPSTET